MFAEMQVSDEILEDMIDGGELIARHINAVLWGEELPKREYETELCECCGQEI